MTDTKRAIVIGSGAGGLSAAAYLAKDGLDVVVLEQAGQVGGYLAPFRRDGYLFDPGVHYVGEVAPGRIFHDVLVGLDLDPNALFCELDPDGFDVYRFPDSFEMRACRGLERYRERLTERFPHERSGLHRLFELVKHVDVFATMMMEEHTTKLRWLAARTLKRLPFMLRWGSRTLDELLRAHVSDPRLRAVLAAAGGDYGEPPRRASAIVGLQLLAHYAHGAFFPRGGSGALRDALVRAAERNGARFRTGARVTAIRTRDGRATSVQLATGEQLEADVIVSDVDPVRTLGQMLDGALLPRSLRDKIAHTTPSLGVCALFLGMRRDLRRHGLGASNVWSHWNWDIDAEYAAAFQGRLPDEPLLFLSPNSLKDDSQSMAPPGCSTLEVMTVAPYAPFRKWSDKPSGERGDDYRAEKERITEWMLAAIDRRFPDLIGDIEVREMSTPLTDEHYTLAIQGGIYGPAMTAAQSGIHRFPSTTPVPNVILAGAGVLGDGVAPCAFSGRVAARFAIEAVSARRARALPRMREAHP